MSAYITKNCNTGFYAWHNASAVFPFAVCTYEHIFRIIPQICQCMYVCVCMYKNAIINGLPIPWSWSSSSSIDQSDKSFDVDEAILFVLDYLRFSFSGMHYICVCMCLYAEHSGEWSKKMRWIVNFCPNFDASFLHYNIFWRLCM